MNKKAVVIAGYGSLPLIGAKELKLQGYSIVVIALKESCTKTSELKEIADSFYEYSIGHVGKIFKTLKKEQVTHALLSGKVEIRLLHTVSFDLKALWMLTKLKFRSTDSINIAIIKELKKLNISIINQKETFKNLIYKSQIFTGSLPDNPEFYKDIKEGFLFAKKIGSLDLGQSIVISNGKILAVETAEGTDKTFARGCALGSGSAICVKTGKLNQDERFDLPTVGVDTLTIIASNNGKVLVVEACETIIIELEKCIDYAKNHNILFMSVDSNLLDK